MRLDPFLLLCREHGLPAPATEVRFLPDRQFRGDYVWTDARVIVEREGGIWRGGRRPGTAGIGHSAGAAILRDMQKGNLAQLHGWLYLRYTPEQLDSGGVLDLLKVVLAARARHLPADEGAWQVPR